MGSELLIELVPSSTWGWNLRSELTRSEWDTLRQSVYKKANHQCEVCGGKGRRHPVECHEKWEYDDENHVQRLVGLEALCPSCHEVRHLGRAFSVGRGSRAIAHLARVNGWSVDEAEAHCKEVFAKWGKRSAHDWTLDISWLAGEVWASCR